MKPNFNDFRVRCSSIGALMTEPQLKADKEAGNLSQTAKSQLIKDYSKWVDKRWDDIQTNPLRKGIMQEEESITLVSALDGVFYQKNETRMHNEWITGECDIDYAEQRKIIDIKSSWSNTTFLNSMMKPLDSDYYWQGQGYCWLYDRDCFEIVHVLVNAPFDVIESEKRKYLWSIGNPQEHDAYIQEALQQIEKNHTFDDMPPAYRVTRKLVQRSDFDIERISLKVMKARQFLEEIWNIRNNNTNQ